jgi:hypothetical protein
MFDTLIYRLTLRAWIILFVSGYIATLLLFSSLSALFLSLSLSLSLSLYLESFLAHALASPEAEAAVT